MRVERARMECTNEDRGVLYSVITQTMDVFSEYL